MNNHHRWRRRLALIHRVLDMAAAGRRIFLVTTARGLALYEPAPLPGRCVYDSCGQILYRLIG